MKKYKWLVIYTFLFASTVLMFLFYAVGNYYPLMFSDTGSYVISGMTLELPNDRPVMYGLLINLTSFNCTLWNIVIFQSIILAYFLLLVLKCSLGNYKLAFFLLPLLGVFLTLLTGVSFFVSIVTPDIFSAIVILGILIIISFPELWKIHRITVLIITVITSLTHFSNFINILSLVLAFTVLFIFFRKKEFVKIRRKSFYLIAILAIFTFTTNYLINLSFGTKGKIARSSYAHPFATLLESGLVHEFLNENCDDSSYSFCRYIDKLPKSHATFLWDFEHSPLYFDCIDRKMCMVEKNEEMSQIIHEMLGDPRYLKRMFVFSLERTWDQLWTFQIITLPKYDTEYPIIDPLYNHLYNDLEAFTSSCQYQQGFNVGNHNKYIKWFIYLSVVIVILAFSLPWFYRKLSTDIKVFLWMFIVAMLSNAYVCSVLSSGSPRYQGRIVWIFSVIAFIAIVLIIRRYRSRKA